MDGWCSAVARGVPLFVCSAINGARRRVPLDHVWGLPTSQWWMAARFESILPQRRCKGRLLLILLCLSSSSGMASNQSRRQIQCLFENIPVGRIKSLLSSPKVSSRSLSSTNFRRHPEQSQAREAKTWTRTPPSSGYKANIEHFNPLFDTNISRAK